MNKQIARLGICGLVLIAALIVATTYWQTWASAGLADRQDNAIQRVAQYSIRRGLIYTRNRKVLAANRARKVSGRTLYFRRYPQGRLAPQVVGYSTVGRAQAGLERSLNDYLTGSNANLDTVFSTTLDRLKGATVKGNDVYVTIDGAAQRVANYQLAGKCGSIVALEPKTGRVLVMASSPTYNENEVQSNAGYARIQRITGACLPAAPLLNRATDGLFTPGSSFKIVTAAAALDSGAYTPDSSFYDPGYCIEYHQPVSNAGNPDQNGPETFGTLNLFTAFQHSVNSVFCNIGQKLGAAKILEYARKFGFYSTPPLETPLNERVASGRYKNHRLELSSEGADPGRIAFGQENLLVTPLQGAMVAAAIANRGVVMKPYVVDRIVAPGGKVIRKTKPEALRRAVKTKVAQELTQMMVAAVTGGTGGAAQLSGISVAGKTGTAETGVSHVNTTWFVCFAPAENPKVAVAVVLENQHGFAGQTAAPIARTMMQAILQRGSK